MSNLVRKLENEITNSDHEQEDGSAFIRFPLKFFLPLLGLLLALASINSGLIYFDLLTPTAISPYISSFTVLTLITLTAFIAPLEVGALSLLVTFLYFNLYSIPSYMTQAAVYGICIALASWFLAGRLLRGSLKILQVEILALESVESQREWVDVPRPARVVVWVLVFFLGFIAAPKLEPRSSVDENVFVRVTEVAALCTR